MQLVLLIVALVLFGLGAFSHWFGAPERPYYPALLCAGLFFATLSYLWPQIR